MLALASCTCILVGAPRLSFATPDVARARHRICGRVSVAEVGLPGMTAESAASPITLEHRHSFFENFEPALFANPQPGKLNELIADLLGVLTFMGLIIYLLVDRRLLTEERRRLTAISDDLKRSKQALYDSEEKFRLLAENVPGVIYLCRGDNRDAMQFLNGAVQELTGYPKDDFLGGEISLDALSDVSDLAKIHADIKRALAEHRPFRLVYRLKTRSGEWRWVEEFGVGIFHEDVVLYVEGFLSDITHRKQAEEALRTSEARYRLLFERNLAGVYRCTPDGKVTDCNEAFARMCGFTSCEDVREDKNWEFFRTGSERRLALLHLRQQRRLTNCETQVERSDGKLIWVLENASLLKDKADSPEFIEGTLFDITGRKRAEQMVEQFKRQNELILNAAGEGICGVDARGEITFINPAAARMLGRSSVQLLNRPHHALLHPPSGWRLR
jgi:PAS domain S-box-containing protein